jgi:hypothetical protein
MGVIRTKPSGSTVRRVTALVAASFLAMMVLWPATPDDARGAIDPALAFDKVVLKGGGGEPDMAISPSGKIMMVAGLGNGSPAVFHRSTDFGRTFTKIAPSFDITGGGDWDMYFLDDQTLVGADLTIGDGIYVHRSTDGGDTWTATKILSDQYDRPWLDHYGRDLVYVVAKGFDGIPYLYQSGDGGKTFGTPPVPLIVYGVPGQGGPTPVDAFVTNQNAYVDHLVVDPRSGDVYVLYGIGKLSSYNADQPLGSSNEVYVAHLEQGRMVSYRVYSGGPDDSFISGFNWMTVDPGGTLYALIDGRINGHHSARLTYSKDKGRTWSALIDIAPPGAANVYGAIAAVSRSELSLAYIRGSNEDPNTEQLWFAEMARVTNADTPTPTVRTTRPLPQPIHLKDICFNGILCGFPGFGNDRNLLDYLWVSVDPRGKAFGVFPSDGPATGGSNDRSPDVLVLRQSGSGLAPVLPKPVVRGTKTTRRGTSLPATGVGGPLVAEGALLIACAAGIASRLRDRARPRPR